MKIYSWRNRMCYLVICLIFFCISCAHAPDPYQDIPIPQIIEAFHKKAEKIQSLSTNLFVEIDDGKNTLKGKGVLVLHKPDSLRLEILSFFGNPIEVLATANHQFQYYSSEYNEFFYGNASQSNLMNFFPIPFEIPELLELITGGVTHTSTISQLEKKISSQDTFEIIIQHQQNILERMIIDQKKNVIISISFSHKNQEVFALTFDNFQKLMPQLYIAKDITFHDKKRKSRMKIQFEKFDQINQSFSPDTFELDIPEDGKKSFFP